jgi:long-chain acyl-CoA synthetase
MRSRAENLIELAQASVARFGNRPLFGEQRGGTWQWMTYAGWQRHVDGLRAGLAALGIGPGDRIAIVSRNSAAWATAAYATYGLGAAFVPMYEAQRPEEWEFILRDCEAKVVLGRTHDIATTLAAMQPRLPALQHVLAIEGPASDPRTVAAIEQRGRAAPLPPHAIDPHDIAGLVYTSGTTGFPKGVMLSHHNLTTNINAALAVFPLSEHDRSLSFLPWAHVFGQVCELHILVGAGASTAFNVDTNQLIEDLHEVKPTILVAVPRIFNRIHEGVRGKMEHRPRVIRNVFENGLSASIRAHRGERLSLMDHIWRLLAAPLFFAVRRKFGGRLKYAISGSATLSRDTAEFINGLGIEVYEGYGLTETSPIVAMNRPGHRKIGSVGLPIENVTVEIDETRGSAPGEGEIVVHGPNVMKGYHARPEENARAFTPDGGFRTGDLGSFDADGYLSITGRIKEQYKLENGKYVMPGPIEERLTLSPFIRNVMLYGAGKPFNVALVAIDVDQVQHWATEHHLDLAADITRDSRVRSLIQRELDSHAAELRGYERPRACTLTIEAFSVENGMLTPTLKVKRATVTSTYGTMLEALYSEPLPPSEEAPRATVQPARA